FPLMRVGDDTLVLRDYHADNLMWLPQRDGIARVGLLDFQDGVLGPPAYDLVSLLQDCRRVVPQSLEMTLLDEYITHSPGLERDDFTRAYALLGVQRNIKIIGIFTRLWKRDGKPFYPSLIPRVWELVERGLNWPGLEEIAPLSALRDWLHAQAEPALRQQMLPGLPSARRGERA
ncbi:MAG: phosphotransferase, partial [Alphaproteobacteria bacterium]|nr:phosphotransferase [Alphaproteobacteria bacterium]